LQRRSLPIARFIATAATLFAATLLGACATYEPQPLVLDTDLQGVQTETIDDVTVSVAILTDEQAAQHFGVDFARNGLQALWLRVHNASPRQFWFIRNTVDPDFYSADEAAVLAKDSLSGDHFDALRQHLRDESIRVQHRPMTITEGFLYLPRIEGGRFVDIRLGGDVFDLETDETMGQIDELRFGFAVPLPDGLFDYEKLDAAHTYGDVVLPDVEDPEMLREHLEKLPCCAMDDDGEEFGDPLNVVLIGDSQQVLTGSRSPRSGAWPVPRSAATPTPSPRSAISIYSAGSRTSHCSGRAGRSRKGITRASGSHRSLSGGARSGSAR
jgi:hypothetical protein